MTNVLPVDTRIVVIEDTRELNLGADPRARRRRCSSGRPARPTSRASARSPSASSCATPCASTPTWLIVGEVRDGDAAREMLLAMQHGHPSLSTVHHHSALSAWKKLAQYVAQGAEAVEFPIAALLISDAVDFFVHLGRDRQGRRAVDRDLRGRRLERHRGAAQPAVRRRSRRARHPAAAPHRRPPHEAARPRLRGPPAAERGRVVVGVTASPLARRAARRGARARRRARRRRLARAARPPPHGAAPRRVRTPTSCSCARRPGARRRAPSPGWWTRWLVAAVAVGLARLAGAVVRRPAGPAARASWPARRPSPSGPRCCATCSSSNAGLHEAIGKSARVAPGGDPRRGPGAVRPRPARRPVGGARPLRRRHGRRHRRHRRHRAADRRPARRVRPRRDARRGRHVDARDGRHAAAHQRGAGPHVPHGAADRRHRRLLRRPARASRNRSYMEPFGTFAGQLVLVGVCAHRRRRRCGRWSCCRARPAPSACCASAGASTRTPGGGADDLGGPARRRMLGAGVLARRPGAGAAAAAAARRWPTSSSRRAPPARRVRSPAGGVAALVAVAGRAARRRRRRRGWPPTSPCSGATPDAPHARQARLRACCSSPWRSCRRVAVPAARRRRAGAHDGARRAAVRRRRLARTPTSRCGPGPSPARRSWAQALTVYVDIVGISLAGGAGVEDALMVAAQAGSGPAVRAARRRAAGRPDPPPQAVAGARRARRAGRHPPAARAGVGRRPRRRVRLADPRDAARQGQRAARPPAHRGRGRRPEGVRDDGHRPGADGHRRRRAHRLPRAGEVPRRMSTHRSRHHRDVTTSTRRSTRPCRSRSRSSPPSSSLRDRMDDAVAAGPRRPRRADGQRHLPRRAGRGRRRGGRDHRRSS